MSSKAKKKKLRSVYVVAIESKGGPENVGTPPILGVHSNLNAAQKHFNNCIKHRIELGAKATTLFPMDYDNPTRAVLATKRLQGMQPWPEAKEEIRLERWRC